MLMGSKLQNLLDIPLWMKLDTFQCMGKVFCVELERVSLKWWRKYQSSSLLSLCEGNPSVTGGFPSCLTEYVSSPVRPCKFWDIAIVVWLHWRWEICQQNGTVSKMLMGSKLQNLLDIPLWMKLDTFQCMGKVFCVELERVSLKFHTIYSLRSVFYGTFTILKSSML